MKIASTALLFLAVTLSAGVKAATEETGDILDGYPVITNLDTTSLEDGSYRYWFRGAENAIGGFYDIPVMVKKNGTGPKLFLQSSIHGDELAGAQIIQHIFKELDTTMMNGTVVGIIGANPTGILLHNRNFYTTTDGGSYTNLNRLMPGSNTSSDAGAQLCYTLRNNLYMPSNPDVFLDLHTQSRGTEYPFFIYSDRRNSVIDALVVDMPADIVKDDAGEDGTVETEMVKAGVPAMTIELGAPKEWNDDKTKRGVQGVKNTMYNMGIVEDEVDMMGINTYYCNDITSIRATRGGYADIVVELEEDVEEGQVVATQFNAFGDVRANYTAPWAGRVLSIGTDPIREPGSLMVRLCRQLEPEEPEAVTKNLRGSDLFP